MPFCQCWSTACSGCHLSWLAAAAMDTAFSWPLCSCLGKAVIGGNKRTLFCTQSKQTSNASFPLWLPCRMKSRCCANGQSRLPCFIKGKSYFTLFPPYLGKTVLGWLLVPRDDFNCSLYFFILGGNGGCILLLRCKFQSTLDSTGAGLIGKMYKKHWHLWNFCFSWWFTLSYELCCNYDTSACYES